jgi:hypothetical protein
VADHAKPLRSHIQTAGLASGGAALALWGGILVAEWPRLTAIGMICGEESSLFGHCAACYPAAALTLFAACCGLAGLTISKSAPITARQAA